MGRRLLIPRHGLAPVRRSGRGRATGRIGLLAGLVLLALSLGGCEKAPQPAGRMHQRERTDAVASFLDEFWARPLRAQGMPPPRFSPLEAALDPGSCGTCHAAQFNDWTQSLHAHAMGPGIAGQIANMAPDAADEHQDCIRCHAPLKEQADGLAAYLAVFRGSRGGQDTARPLHEQGLVCAACHVRGHQRYGPPRRDGSTPDTAAQLPHNGWVSSSAFEDSRFCAACHQFREDEYALNGKLLENTYEEWKASRHAREGRTCQSCHMPDRRHLWRGIHDLDMVKSGVTINLTAASVQSGVVTAALTIKNTGTGHHFPTYVTPRVVAEAYQENSRGEMLKETLRRQVIARQVALDLSKEIADTRIAADEQAVFDYHAPLRARAVALVLRVRVEPDAFYTDFYRSLLEAKQAGKGERLIKQALEKSLASHFSLYSARFRLKE